jgi:hypothetical protein
MPEIGTYIVQFELADGPHLAVHRGYTDRNKAAAEFKKVLDAHNTHFPDNPMNVTNFTRATEAEIDAALQAMRQDQQETGRPLATDIFPDEPNRILHVGRDEMIAAGARVPVPQPE